MNSLQSPPGWVNLNELLAIMGFHIFQRPLERMGLVSKKRNKQKDIRGKYLISHKIFDVRNLDEWETQFNKMYIQIMSFFVVELNTYEDGSHKIIKISKKKFLKFDFCPNYIYVLKAMHMLRYLLSSKLLNAYVMHNYTYQIIPSEFWHDDWNWYRLLADCSLNATLPIVGEIFGSVYFKEEEVKRCVANDHAGYSTNTATSSLINLSDYSTPWLQVLAAIYDEYGKDKLAQVAKISIESFVAEYIKKHNLDISSSDIPFLAKFMRLAEQKEGKKYHAKMKSKNQQ